MASSHLVLPGMLFVGEDERARIVAHMGPAAGWCVPAGIGGWSHEVSVVVRETLTEDIRRSTKAVLPEEQIAPARMPLTHQAAQKSPLIAISQKLAPKLVEAGVRVHTIGVDRITSSFYYIAEGGDEEPIRVEGDLVQAVGSMLGERADNAAIERVLDGLVDRLIRALSRDRVSELTLELAAALPRAAADGTGTQDIDLDRFEAELSKLVGDSEKFSAYAREIASKLAEANDRRIEVPLFSEARKVSQGPFELAVGERTVALPTSERWVMSQPLTEPDPAAAKMPSAPPRPASVPPPAAKPLSSPPPPARVASTPPPAAVTVPSAPPPKPASVPPVAAAAPVEPPKAASPPAPKVAAPASKPAQAVALAPPIGSRTAEEAKSEPRVVAAPAPAPAPEPKVEAKPEPKVEEPKAEAKPVAVAPKEEPKRDEPKKDEVKAAPKEERLVAAKAATPAKAPAEEPKKNLTWVILVAALVVAALLWRMLTH